MAQDMESSWTMAPGSQLDSDEIRVIPRDFCRIYKRRLRFFFRVLSLTAGIEYLASRHPSPLWIMSLTML